MMEPFPEDELKGNIFQLFPLYDRNMLTVNRTPDYISDLPGSGPDANISIKLLVKFSAV